MTTLDVAGLTLLASYLIGAIPFGYLVARWRGVDILRQGSGNIGATNVGRILGRRLGIVVFLLDFAKGALPVLGATAVARLPGLHLQPSLTPDELGVIAGLSAFLGHLFPIYLRFRGGKGVATGAGVIAVLLPGPALVALLTWVAIVCASRYVSLASISAVLALCLARLVTPHPFAAPNWVLTLFCLLAAALVLLKHRANIARLLKGNENRLRESGSMLTFTKVVHVLALGLWFGSAAFFPVVAVSLFHSFESVAEKNPAWFRPAEPFRVRDEVVDGPKEQGIRAAGYAIGPLFARYFAIQAVCALLATATALPWARVRRGQRLHQWRLSILAVALVTVIAGWWLEDKVSDLRRVRDGVVDTYLQHHDSPDSGLVAQVLQAKAEFGRWHGYSLVLSFVTLALVTCGMALAACLPAATGEADTATRQEGADGKKDVKQTETLPIP